MGEGNFRPEQIGTSHLRPPKGPKTAKNGHLAIFLAGTRWNSPLKVKSEAMSGLSPAKKVILGPLWPAKRPKMANFGHFSPVDHILAWIKVELTNKSQD